MFAKLTGVVDDLAEDHLVLDVNGVGYLVAATTRTLDRLRIGCTVALRIETQVGEDHIRLFGFQEAGEQRWFRLLQSVQGVGARVALAILSVLPPDRLAAAIAAQDKASLGQAHGVGRKLAERIVTELKDKAGQEIWAMSANDVAAKSESAKSENMGHAPAAAVQAHADAVSALVNLGYKPADAMMAVQSALGKSGADLPVGELIRVSLKEAAGTIR